MPSNPTYLHLAQLLVNKSQESDRHGELVLEHAKVCALISIAESLEALKDHLPLLVDQTGGL